MLARGRRAVHHAAPGDYQRPETGTQNYGIYRMQVYDSRTTGMHWQTHKVGARHYRASSDRLDVAVALGGDPASIWTGSAPLPPEVDEMTLAGFIRDAGVELTPAVSVDLMVPANAEIVLEGYVVPGEERTEGPFGDHTGYYSLAEPYRCSTWRPSHAGRIPSTNDVRGPPAHGGLLDGQGHGSASFSL